MGGVAFGIRNNRSINPANPASYSAVDSLTFMFDLGLSGLFTHFSDASGIKNTFNGNLEYIALQFPITKWLGFSAGLLPYSSVGYEFGQNGIVEMPTNIIGTTDTIQYTSIFYGTGGISQVYAGLSFNILNHVSLGVNAYYMFGSINNYRQLSFTNSSYSSLQQSNNIKANKFRFRFGAQFYHTFAEKHNVTLGLVYEYKSKLNGQFQQIETTTTDTTTSSNNGFDLPAFYGGGLSYTYDDRLTIGIDYSLQDWATANYFGVQDSLRSCQRIAIGAEYRHDPLGKKYSERMLFRIGGHISDPYIDIINSNIKNFGITFGVGFPLRNTKTYINASFEYGKKGTVSTLREDYCKLTISASFNETWFFKRKL